MVNRRRRAVVAVLTMVLMVVLLGFAAIAVDYGHLCNVRAELQHAADAAALAAAGQLSANIDATSLATLAAEIAQLNHPGNGDLIGSFQVGSWNADDLVFTPNGTPENAVRVVTVRNEQNNNPVGLYFAAVFGVTSANGSAAATAYAPGSSGEGLGSRFLIDNEMFDTDIPVIEDLAEFLGVSPDHLLSDSNGDGFIDLPPGELELPTGQVGDEALFEIGAGFPFTETSDPSLEDFLLFVEGGDQHGISTEDLDPLLGVEPVSDPDQYEDYVSDQVMVMPVYKSDVSDTEPGVNALGERRGLVAFRIIGVGEDPDGGGSQLPNLIIEIVSPDTIDTADVTLGGGPAGAVVLVQECPHGDAAPEHLIGAMAYSFTTSNAGRKHRPCSA